VIFDSVALASTPYLLSRKVLDALARSTDEDFDAAILPHVALLESVFRRSGQATAVLSGVCSLLSALSEFHGRRSIAIARLYALEALLLLASGNDAIHAHRAGLRAHAATQLARQLDTPDVAEFVAEEEMVTAVAMKATGDIDGCLAHLRAAARQLGPYEIAVPLIRQEALLFQDRNLFDKLLKQASTYRASRRREYYRTLKRTFEFELNSGNIQDAAALLPELLWSSSRSPMKVLDRLSLLKNLAQMFGAMGQYRRAMVVLDVALAVAAQSGFHGQERQIRTLRASFSQGTPGRLISFELR
jgi:hypothetical protein